MSEATPSKPGAWARLLGSLLGFGLGALVVIHIAKVSANRAPSAQEVSKTTLAESAAREELARLRVLAIEREKELARLRQVALLEPQRSAFNPDADGQAISRPATGDAAPATAAAAAPAPPDVAAQVGDALGDAILYL